MSASRSIVLTVTEYALNHIHTRIKKNTKYMNPPVCCFSFKAISANPLFPPQRNRLCYYRSPIGNMLSTTSLADEDPQHEGHLMEVSARKEIMKDTRRVDQRL